MSTSITMIVPVKNTVPGVSNVFSAPGNTGQVLMAKPVHQQPEGDKSNETKAAGGSDRVSVSDSSTSARIKVLNKQIQALQQKLVDLKDSDSDPKEIEKQQAEQMAKANESIVPAKGDGINRPTAANAVDVYI